MDKNKMGYGTPAARLVNARKLFKQICQQSPDPLPPTCVSVAVKEECLSVSVTGPVSVQVHQQGHKQRLASLPAAQHTTQADTHNTKCLNLIPCILPSRCWSLVY